MKKLYELLHVKKEVGDVGVEIECEGEGLKAIEDFGWTSVSDGSLRGEFPKRSCEWVLEKPVLIQDVKSYLQELLKFQSKAKFKFSFRTSVHIHINVQELTVDQIINMMYTYLLCETALMNKCGKSRIGNRFCLRLDDAESLSFQLQSLIRNSGHFLFRNPGDAVRYASMNISSIWKYGSLEFRGMEGNLDPDRITNWAQTLVNIRSFACKFNNIQDVHDFFVKSSPKEFFNAAIGDRAVDYIYDELEYDMRRNFSYTIDLPYAYKRPVEEVTKVATSDRILANWIDLPGDILE